MQRIRVRVEVEEPPAKDEDVTDERDDDHLMARFAQGDHGAFMELVERHQTGVSTYVLHILGRGAARNRAADVTQDVFARVIARSATYTAEGRFKAWLYTIARNRCLDVLASAPVRRELPLDPHAWEPTGTGPAPDASLRHSQLKSAVDSAVEQLSPRQAQVFALHRAGVDHADSAQVLGLSRGAVKYHLHQARVRLRAELAEFLNP